MRWNRPLHAFSRLVASPWDLLKLVMDGEIVTDGVLRMISSLKAVDCEFTEFYDIPSNSSCYVDNRQNYCLSTCRCQLGS